MDISWPCQNMTSTPAARSMKKAFFAPRVLCIFNTYCTRCLPLWNVHIFTHTFSSCGSRGGGTGPKTSQKLQSSTHWCARSNWKHTQLWHILPLFHTLYHTNFECHMKIIMSCCITQKSICIYQSKLVITCHQLCLVGSFKPKDAFPLSPTFWRMIVPLRGSCTELSNGLWCSPSLIRHGKMNE